MPEPILRLALAGVLLTVVLSGCGGGGGASAQSPAPTPTQLPPTTPVVTLSKSSAYTGDSIAMSANSSDPQGSALTYGWNFGDGASATGASVTHIYSVVGQFSPQVTVSNSFKLSSVATSAVALVVTQPRPPNFQIFSTNTGHFLGETLQLETSLLATDTNGLPITYSWSFGDGATASGAKTTHVYAAPGSYTVVLTVMNSAGGTSTAQVVAKVAAATPQPVPVNNQFAAYCAGPYCGASDAGTYSGSGVGIWRYHNSTPTDATLAIAIQGVNSGLSASLVFSNDSAVDSLTLPGAGVLMSTATVAVSPSVAAAQAAAPDYEAAHAQMLQRNLAAALQFVQANRSTSVPVKAQATLGPVGVSAPPALGTKRVWTEFFGTPTSYAMEVAATCALATGRNAVFWLDSAQLADGAITRARIDFLVAQFCGATGAYERQVAITGDVWGPAAAGKGYIEDTPGVLQDIHIVIPGVPASTAWGGYFASSNLGPSVSGGLSNGALALFINANLLTRSATDTTVGATMVHELKHMTNYYQRTIARNAIHPVWLEESSAMLSEDLFTLPYLGYNRAELRHEGYVASGGGIGYLGWTHPEGNSYNQGGSFGSFLHRRYGLDLDRRLIDSCNDNGTPQSGYQCVDALIRQWGGNGMADEFSRLGASVFGGLDRGDFPSGFGFPSIEREGFLLPSFTSAEVRFPPAQISPRVITQFLATMHSYQLDFIAAGQTVYQRSGVVVPAGTTLMLVIR
jgi:PKD repeat protein